MSGKEILDGIVARFEHILKGFDVFEIACGIVVYFNG